MLNLSNIWARVFNGESWFSMQNENKSAYYQLEIGALTDRGRNRPINQDSIGVFQSPDGHDCIAIVADGMGGHQAGEVASRLAVEAFSQDSCYVLNHQSPETVLQQMVETANNTIFAHAQLHSEYHGMGTTLVVLKIHKTAAYFAHTGDSRLYCVRDSQIDQLTEDHTVLAEMLRQGLIDAEQAKNHPDKHIITHAVGTAKTVTVETQHTPFYLRAGDRFILCSDGLHDLVDDIEMQDISTRYPAQQACQTLVQLANARGGHDNISVIVIKIGLRDSVGQHANKDCSMIRP